MDPNAEVTNKSTFLKSKKFIIIAVVILIVLLFLAIFFTLSSKDKSSQTTTPTPISLNSSDTYTSLDLRKIAAEANKYVTSQKRSDGFYNYLENYKDQCTTTNGIETCPFNNQEMFQTTNAWTALAHYSQSIIANSSQELTMAQADLNKLMDWCEPDPKQCLWVLMQPILIYEKTQDAKTLAFLKQEGEVLLSSLPSDNLMLASIETRELAALYKLTDDARYLQSAIRRMQVAQELLSKAKSIFPENIPPLADFACWTTLAQLQTSVNDPETRNNARFYLNQRDLIKNFKYFKNPIQIQPCIETYALLGLMDRNSKDKKTASTLLNMFLKDYYDGPSQKIFYGSGGTAFFSRLDKDASAKTVVLTDSAYTVYLISLINQF